VIYSEVITKKHGSSEVAPVLVCFEYSEISEQYSDIICYLHWPLLREY